MPLQTMMPQVLFALLYLYVPTLSVPTLLNTTSSLSPRGGHGRCSFHVEVKQYCDKRGNGWDLFTSVSMPYIRDASGHPIRGLTWGPPNNHPKPEPIETSAHTVIPGVKYHVWGLEKTFDATWWAGPGLMEYNYKGCDWNAANKQGSGKCASCGKGEWTSRESPADPKGCDDRRRWRTHDMDCFFQC